MNTKKESNDWMYLAIFFMMVSLVIAGMWIFTPTANPTDICIPKIGGIYEPLTEKGFIVAVIPIGDSGKALVDNLNRQMNPELYSSSTQKGGSP